MRIQDIEINDPVIYIPKNLLMAGEPEMTRLENTGRVTSKNDRFVFVRYRGKSGSEATYPGDLYPLRNRPDLIELLDNPEMTIEEQAELDFNRQIDNL